MSYCKFDVITSHMSEGLLKGGQSQMASTPWGGTEVYIDLINGINIAVILYYGNHADMASYLVNSRSNIWGLKELGVRQIISQSAIGSCNPHIRPGDFVVLDDAMGSTKKRVLNFFKDRVCWVRVDTSEPFCGSLRGYPLEAYTDEQIPVYSTGIFVCIEGPRSETSTEVRYYNSIRRDIIGTSMSPELVLAKGIGMCYASFSMAVNMCIGMGPTIYQSGDEGPMTAYEKGGMEDRIRRVLKNLVGRLPEGTDCLRVGLPEKGLFGVRPEWYFQYKRCQGKEPKEG